MKNPIAYFKHLVKDPINNIDEANARKKEILPWFIGSCALGVLTGLLSGIEKLNFLSFFVIFGVVGIMFFGFLLVVIHMAKKRFTVLTCNCCNTLAEIKTAEDFAKYISWSIEKDEAIYKGYSGNKEPTNGVYGVLKVSASSSAVLSVDLTCPHCGSVKHLKYSATPFSCHIEKKNVSVLAYADVRRAMEDAVQAIVNEYNDKEKREHIPYTFHSSKNPNFERRYEFKGANATDAHPDYLGVRIDYHKDAEEIFAHYFLYNELSGTLSDPNPQPKNKAPKGAALLSVKKEVDSNLTDEKIAQPAADDFCETAEHESTCAFVSTNAGTILQPESEIDTPANSEEKAVAPVIITDEAPSFEEPIIDKSTDGLTEAEVKAEPVHEAKEAFATPTASSKQQAKEKEDKKRKDSRPIFIATLSICATLLIASGITIGILLAGQSRNKSSDESKPDEEITESVETTDKTELNVNDYVGYWYVNEDYEKELTIHSGLKDSVTFSLWYSDCEEYEIKNMTVQLNENVADFSLAENGTLIKGNLTFNANAISFEITQSSVEAMPVEALNFTMIEATSQRYSEETGDDLTNDTSTNDDSNVDSITDVYYVVEVLTDENLVYESYSYDSEVLCYLYSGSYAIVAEYVDDGGHLWGKLSSGFEWVCLTDIYESNALYEQEIDNSSSTDDPDIQLEDWQIAYLEYIDENDGEYRSYALICIDSDSIPELYVEYYYDYGVMLSYKNNELTEVEFSIGGGSCRFIEYEGVFLADSGRMGYYYDDVYTLDSSGFNKVFAGSRTENYPPEIDEYGNEYLTFTYMLNDIEVSEQEYNYTLWELFDPNSAIYLYEVTVSSQYIRDDIRNYLKY